jgi:biotin carboxylase
MTRLQTKNHRSHLPRRVLLLLTPRSYRSKAFIGAAEKLDIEIVKAMDMQEELADHWNYPLGLEYGNLERSVEAILEFSAVHPIGAVQAVDDSGTLLAAEVSKALGLPHNSPEAALAARDKYEMRVLLNDVPVNSPEFERHEFTEEIGEEALRDLAVSISYPCVLKPISLSGSRGVIRANDQNEFFVAAERLRALLKNLFPNAGSWPFLVEDFIPGFEVAFEGILDDGSLVPLALFDKPDPLDGPFFEETIYVTPSRLEQDVQGAIFECISTVTEASGLRQGSVHAELRINEEGPWLLEIAGRSIGGLCSDTLRFASENTLEELILRQAFGMEFHSLEREEQASGVMMLPIPEAGIFKGVQGCEEAEAVPLIDKVEITARINYSLKQLPEGDSYLGFIFARGKTPEEVEEALRTAQQKLKFSIAPELPVLMM